VVAERSHAVCRSKRKSPMATSPQKYLRTPQASRD
jgi:hypothetical protein